MLCNLRVLVSNVYTTSDYRNTGYLVFGQDTEEYIISNIESLRLNGIPHQIFSGYEANQRYPRQLKIPSTHKCIYEEMGGILYAKKSLQTFQVYYTYFVMLVVYPIVHNVCFGTPKCVVAIFMCISCIIYGLPSTQTV